MLFVSVVTGGFLALYLSILVSFGFVTHPFLYCALLVGGALSLSIVTIMLFGFSWYLALFILVYVGGVYVLFLYVSVHSANCYPVAGSVASVLSVFYFFLLFFVLFLWNPACFVFEESRFLCSAVEGFGYMSLCFSLLVGFVGVSVVSGQKDSFFR